MAKVLITGASGFIGQHLAEALVAQGDEVTCLVRSTSQPGRLAALPVRLVYGDVTEPESLPAAVAGQQVVYHLAGRTMALRKEDFHRVNVEGTRNVARACARQDTPPVLVMVSSLAAVGPSPKDRPLTEADLPSPVCHYGRSKWAAEQAAAEFAEKVPITIVRPPIVLGGGDRVSLPLFSVTPRLRIHLAPTWARYRYSLIHVADLVHLLVLAAQCGKRLLPKTDGPYSSQGRYFAACEEDPTYADLGRMIGQEDGGKRVLTLRVASPVSWTVAAVGELLGHLRGKPIYFSLDKCREATAGSSICSAQAARDELGFRVQAPLRERLRQTLQWYRSHGWM